MNADVNQSNSHLYKYNITSNIVSYLNDRFRAAANNAVFLWFVALHLTVATTALAAARNLCDAGIYVLWVHL